MRCRPILVVFGLVACLQAGAAKAQLPLNSARRTPIVVAVDKARPSVVNIHGRKLLRGDAAQDGEVYRPVNGMGTGIVIDERGYVVTNYHVVEGVGRIKVTLADKTTLIARLVNHDPRTDLAIIKVDAERMLPVINIGTSSDLMAGETVIAVGNAYGYQHTVTRGIISALHRMVPVTDDQTYQDLIQTDASINPGNSGGPLLNQDGEMIGINVAMRVGAQGIGFALPIDEAMEVIAKLLSVERLSGFSHGVVGRTIVDPQGSRFVVEQVRGKGTIADGLQPGDVVREVAGVNVRRQLDFERALIGRSPGDQVPVSIERSGTMQSIHLSLADAASKSKARGSDIAARLWRELGLRVTPVSPTAPPLVATKYNGGLKVTEVRPASAGQREGIRSGDILVGIHRWETSSMNDLAYILGSSEFRKNQPAQFYIVRGQEVLYGHLSAAGAAVANFAN
jgi:serine protease Do